MLTIYVIILTFFVETNHKKFIKMKKLNLSILAFASLFISCNDDNANEVEEFFIVSEGNLSYSKGTKLDVSEWSWKDATLSGETAKETLSDEYTEDISVSGVVSLTGTTFVRSGATLTFEAGTELVASQGGAEVNIIVEQGGKIVVAGTSAMPVIFSSENGEPGDWGGLTILGKGISSGGVDVEFEVGSYPYGGDIVNDNSGSIKYLIVKGTGAQIDSESQTNGISFCAVGSGTTIENIAVINGDDDGVEFYGGSVSAKNVYLENNSDDSVDWTENWTGGITNVYISHTVKGFSTVFEGDKENGNPTFNNVTAISSVGGRALQFKKASGASVNNLYLEGYDQEIQFADPDLFIIENVKIDGATAVISE